MKCSPPVPGGLRKIIPFPTAAAMHEFTFLKRNEDVEITKRNLPHWEQPEACYFLTFRTADSIPKTVFQEWLFERNQWLASRGIDHDTDENWHLSLATLSQADQAEFHKNFSHALQRHLDQGHGECVLKRTHLREIVADALFHYDRERYVLAASLSCPTTPIFLSSLRARVD